MSCDDADPMRTIPHGKDGSIGPGEFGIISIRAVSNGQRESVCDLDMLHGAMIDVQRRRRRVPEQPMSRRSRREPTCMLAPPEGSNELSEEIDGSRQSPGADNKGPSG